MNGKTVLMVAGMVLALAVVGSAVQADSVKSLRGGVAILDNTQPAAAFEQKQGERFERYYRTQPPLIPHDVEDLEIDLENNACLMCHDRSVYQDSGAPMVGESHYVGPDGKTTEEIFKGRYFCRQCHAPQADAPALVDNTYKKIDR